MSGDRKAGMAIFSAEVHRHLNGQEGDEDVADLATEYSLITALIEDPTVDTVGMIQALAGFGATALLRLADTAGHDPAALLQLIAGSVATEPDDEEE